MVKLTVAALAACIGVAMIGPAPVRPAFAREVPTPSGKPIPVPSGMEVRWLETLRDTQGDEGLTLRFRFVAPALAGRHRPSEDEVSKDMEALCNDYALPRVSKTGPQPAQIVIALADRPSAYGVPDESLRQFFEAYSIENGRCVWEFY